MSKPLTKPNGGIGPRAEMPVSAKGSASPGSQAEGSPQSPYLLEFELTGLPKSPNELLGAHWTIRSGHAKKWKRAVWRMCWHLRPGKPLPKARIDLVRVSSAKSMDEDNLRSSFKPIMDGLKEAGIILDDSPAVVGKPDVRHEKGRPGHGRIRVRVEAITIKGADK